MIDLLFRCFYAYHDLGFSAYMMGILFVFAGFRLTYYLIGVDNID